MSKSPEEMLNSMFEEYFRRLLVKWQYVLIPIVTFAISVFIAMKGIDYSEWGNPAPHPVVMKP